MPPTGGPIMIKEAIERYAAGAAVPGRAIAGLTAADMNALPGPGAWSIQQLIIHLMDSDLIASDRMKRIAAEERPLIIGYNETAFVKNLGYEKLDAGAACELFRANREMTAAVLRNLPETAFSKWGVHNENGKMLLIDLVKGYANHLEHHLKFLNEKRKNLGKGV